MKVKATDYLVFDEETGKYREDPEQKVRDDVEKHYWLHVGRTILKDWRLYVMLIPMILVFLFWRYFPMYELLGCFKVSDQVLPVSEQLFLASHILSVYWLAEMLFQLNSGELCVIPSCLVFMACVLAFLSRLFWHFSSMK